MAKAKKERSSLPKLVQYALGDTPHEVIAFPNTMRDAAEIAAHLGLPAGQLLKTLVVLRAGRGKPILVMVPAEQQLDLKKVAAAAGEKKVTMASHLEAEKLTGLQVGGISALALLNQGFTIFMDDSALAFAEVFVSGGQRGLDVKLTVSDLLRITGAEAITAV